MSVSTWPPLIAYEVGFNAPAGQGQVPPFWTNLSARILWAWRTQRGRYYELDINPTGTWNVSLLNSDGALDPDNAASPYAGGLVPYRCCRIRSQTGVNQLTPDQATAGQASGLLGPIPARLHVVNDQGYALSIIMSGSAYQGSQVYQATLTTGASAGASILLVQQVPVIPGTWYSFQAQARITSGNSVSTNAAVTWWDQNGNNLGTATGNATTLTSGSGTWVQIPVSGQAPSTCYSATLAVEIATGTLTASTTWQIDGLQWENSSIPTPWQLPGTINQNLLPRAIATGSASISPTSDSVSNYWFDSGTNPGTLSRAQFLTPAPTGHTVALAWTTPAGATSSSAILNTGNWLGSDFSGPQPDCVQVLPLTTYTLSWYTMRAASADASLQVTVKILWYTSAGTLISGFVLSGVTVPAGSWTRMVCPATSPADAAFGKIEEVISSPTVTTALNTIYHAAWQFELGGSASTWHDPGATYQIFNGSIERWPQAWELSGTYGKVDAVGVDNFALLSQDIIPAPYIAEVLAMSPNFLFQLNEPAGATSCADTSGNRPAAPVETSPFGAGSLTFGSSITSTSSVGGFLGTTGPVATFANNASNLAPVQYPETFVSVHKTTVNPGPPNSTSWTRMICFRSTATPSASDIYGLWIAIPATYNASNSSAFQIAVNGSGQAFLLNSDATGAHDYSYTGTTNLFDGDWHMIAIGVGYGASPSTTFWVDGIQVATHAGSGSTSGFATDTIGCAAYFGANLYADGFDGDVALAVELPFLCTSAQMTNLYNSWRTASTGDSTGRRTQRVLAWSGYAGPSAIENGATTNMGPATDIAGSSAIDTSTALLPGGVAFTGGSGVQALNTISQTESGNVYCANSGEITFAARTDRYNKTVPTFIFGEHDYAGEWPYELVRTDFDPAHLYTGVQVTQYSSGQVASARSASAAFNYGQRISQLTMNQGLFTETQDAAEYLLGRYQAARTRIPAIQLHPSAVPGLFAVCLQLEIGTRIRVMRRPPNAPARAYELFIESIAWSVNPNKQSAFVTLQCSPADLTTYWTMGALHTTLNAQVNAGATSATINPLPDAAVNALNSSLPQSQQLTFEPGTARAETLTIAPPLPATTVGYSTATLAFTSPFAFTHAAGTTVCEPLPTGYTDPTTWDSGSVLGALATTLAAAASSGASTITVSALPDSTVNPANANWSAGDLLSISPGTADWEGYNLLTPNQSTAGEGVVPVAVGTAGTGIGVSGFYVTPVVTASATAWQGSNVWQSALGASVAAGHTLIKLPMVAVIPGLPFTFSTYVRSVTSGANPQVSAQIGWIGGATVNGTTVTLTGSPSAAWTRVTVTGTAPKGTAWALVGVYLVGAPGSVWNFQADGLQLEQNQAASAYQTCPQIASVGNSVANYATVTLTLANPLTSNHARGDYVCDPLPPGTASPAALGATTRLAY